MNSSEEVKCYVVALVERASKPYAIARPVSREWRDRAGIRKIHFWLAQPQGIGVSLKLGSIVILGELTLQLISHRGKQAEGWHANKVTIIKPGGQS